MAAQKGAGRSGAGRGGVQEGVLRTSHMIDDGSIQQVLKALSDLDSLMLI